MSLPSYDRGLRYWSMLAVAVGISTLRPVAAEPESAGFRLQILHVSDSESAMLDLNTMEPKLLHYSAVLQGLQTLAEREAMASLYLGAGDLTIRAPFFQAAEQVETWGTPGGGDIALYNSFGLSATAIGNNEFEQGLDGFSRLLRHAEFPYLAANLDFSNVRLSERVPALRIGEDGASVQENAGKVVRSSWIMIAGEKIGLVGNAPTDLFRITLDPDKYLPGLDYRGGRDLQTGEPLVSSADWILEQADLLKAQGIDKIVLLDQDFEPLAGQLRDIDVIVFSGTWDLMARSAADGPFNLLRPEDSPQVDYPVSLEDREGNPVLLVNGGYRYRYVGNLMVTFDEAGKIAAWDDRSGPVAATPEVIAALGEVIGDAALQAAEPVKAIYESLLETPLIQDLLIVIGKTRYALNGSVDDLRTRETNLGRLVSDSYLWQARRTAAERGMERRIDLALKNSGGIRDSVLSQEITKFLVGSTLPYDNELAILELSGRELLAALENGVTYAPSRAGKFPQVAGVRVEYDPRRPGVPRAASRDEPFRVVDLDILGDNGEVTSLVRNSRVVGDLSQTFLAVVNGFLLYGGDSYVAFDVARRQPGRVVIEIGVGETRGVDRLHPGRFERGNRLARRSGRSPDQSIQRIGEFRQLRDG